MCSLGSLLGATAAYLEQIHTNRSRSSIEKINTENDFYEQSRAHLNSNKDYF